MIPVPAGTVVRDENTGDLLADVPLVVEQHMLGNIKYFHPGRGLALVVIGMLLADLGMIGDNVIVTV